MSRVLAVIAILAVFGFIIFYTQSPDIVNATTNTNQQEWVGKTFSQGESLFILERPQFFPELIDDVTLALGFEQFTDDQLPQEYRDLATEQKLAEGNFTEQEKDAIKGDLTKSQVVTQTDSHVKGDELQAKLV